MARATAAGLPHQAAHPTGPGPMVAHLLPPGLLHLPAVELKEDPAVDQQKTQALTRESKWKETATEKDM